MRSSEIYSAIETFVREELVEIENSTCLKNKSLEDIGIQSLDILEIIFFIERNYKCKLPREILRGENLKTLDALANFTASFLSSVDGQQKHQ